MALLFLLCNITLLFMLLYLHFQIKMFQVLLQIFPSFLTGVFLVFNTVFL
jgi:hypothetical protein